MALDIKELRELAASDLADKEKQLVQELFNLRFQFGSGRLENPMQIRKTKKDIARVKTVLRQNRDTATGPKE
jgi:large subunit ribosomal protein L29